MKKKTKHTANNTNNKKKDKKDKYGQKIISVFILTLISVSLFLTNLCEITFILTNKNTIYHSVDKGYKISNISNEEEEEFSKNGLNKKSVLSILNSKPIKNVVKTVYYEKFNAIFSNIEEYSINEEKCKEILSKEVSRANKEYNLRLDEKGEEKAVAYLYVKSGLMKIIPSGTSVANYQFLQYLNSVSIEEEKEEDLITNSRSVYYFISLFNSKATLFILVALDILFGFILIKLKREDDPFFVICKPYIPINVIFFGFLINGYYGNNTFIRFIELRGAMFYLIKILLFVGILFSIKIFPNIWKKK